MLAPDLHIHLDGSLRAETILDLAGRRGAPRDPGGLGGIIEDLRFRPGMTLQSCLDRFAFVVALLQSRTSLTRAALELVRDAFADGVRHAEIRFCPLLHTREGLRAEDALEGVLEGIDAALAGASGEPSDDAMSAAVVVTLLEGSSGSDADRLVDLAIEHAGTGVAGVDVAGDESLFDAARFARPLGRAARAGLGITVHAGEEDRPEHVREAVLTLGASRIGHGVAAARDPAVLDLLAERGVTLEVCLSSNVHTGAVAGVASHPLPTIMAHGVSATLATDNTFFSRTTLSREYGLAGRELRLGRESLARLAVDGARAAFLPENERARLVARLERPEGARTDGEGEDR